MFVEVGRFGARRSTMAERNNRSQVVGLSLHLLIAGLLMFTGSQKVLGLVPAEALARYGLGGQVRLIGAGAILTALLLLIPRTSSLGVLLTSSFWGGTICIHMAHDEPYLLQAALLVLSWAGAYLRSAVPFRSLPGISGNRVGGAARVVAVQTGILSRMDRWRRTWHYDQGAGI
jgi:hypothetical protein